MIHTKAFVSTNNAEKAEVVKAVEGHFARAGGATPPVGFGAFFEVLVEVAGMDFGELANRVEDVLVEVCEFDVRAWVKQLPDVVGHVAVGVEEIFFEIE